MTDTLICSNCSYENVVVSCGFCLQCGYDTKNGNRSSAAEASAQADPPLPTAAELPPATDLSERRVTGVVAEDPAAALQHLLCQLSEREEFSWKEMEGGWCVEVVVNQRRRQQVLLTIDRRRATLRLLSPCGPDREELAQRLLETNSRLPFGAFATSVLGTQRITVVTETVPSAQLECLSFQQMLTSIATTAAALKQQSRQASEPVA